MAWKVKSKKEIYRNNWMWITEDEIETESGEKITFGVVHKNPFSVVIPWDGERITLVGQYRYTVDKFSWEFPMGHFTGKDVETTAKDELEEEGGLKAEKLEEIGTFYSSNGFCDQQGFVFLATGLSKTKPKREKSEKGMRTKKVTLKEIEEMIVSGEITDGPTITALHLLSTKKPLRSTSKF